MTEIFTNKKAFDLWLERHEDYIFNLGKGEPCSYPCMVCYHTIGEPVMECQDDEDQYDELVKRLGDSDCIDGTLFFEFIYPFDFDDIPAFGIGDLVRWNDPALAEFEPNEQEFQKGRVYEIYDIHSEIICICDEYGEGEVLAHELELVKKADETD